MELGAKTPKTAYKLSPNIEQSSFAILPLKRGKEFLEIYGFSSFTS